MAIGDGQNWDESNPQQSTLANTIDSYERDIRIGVRGRMANEHVWPSSQTGTSQAGQHTYISLQAQTGTPIMPLVASVTQAGMIFMTTGALVFQNSGAQLTTIVNSGKTSVNILGAQYSSTGTLGEMLIGTTGGTLTILPPGSSGSILIATTGGQGILWGSASGLGVWGSATAGPTQATSDGFYIVSANVNGGNVLTFSLLTDNNATPSTVRARNIISATGGANMFTLMTPVKKLDYYSATASGGSINTGFFIPLGT